MPAPKEVVALVERFQRNRSSYQAPTYNETQTRREFIDPFFEALGWDVDNSQGYAEPYKDVIHEYALLTAGGTKAPDYSFRIGGNRKFFLEAKKPSVRLKQDATPAFQLRRYAWSAKLPIGVLTNFAELAVYDSRFKPSAADSAAAGRVIYKTVEDYVPQWSEISDLLARESVLRGAFDAFAQGLTDRRGTAQVDDDFLGQLEGWRVHLARHLALRNPVLSEEQLNFAVQQTLDRLVFLRICEDRGIEEFGQLRKLLDGPGTYPALMDHFRRADDRYNSGLFHFNHEGGRPEPDSLTPTLRVDDAPLKDIIRHLYYPDSPYEFKVLPADILGQVYEQFLGQVIRLSGARRVQIEEKPEVRRQGGVYYTPSFIVDHIVAGTVGPLLKGKSVRQASQIRILDPACGSGSFLIAAYQYLLDWHLTQYTDGDVAVFA